ncbi:MAG TPA: cytochrome c [Vicinamibacterales bacterium]|jgi:mono/diheme cytochrome c family protein|nr:cytochrome c [Vicinamibacterales bacterium]
MKTISNTRKWTKLIFAAACLWALCVSSALTSHAQAAAAPAQDTATPAAGSGIWSGVYTEAQAKRGEATGNQRCSACHGSDFMGGEAGPALVGLEFLGNWNQQTLGDFFDRIHSTMPADAPGSLSSQDTADVIARVLQLNKFPAGQKELPTDMNALGQIKIESTPPAK